MLILFRIVKMIGMRSNYVKILLLISFLSLTLIIIEPVLKKYGGWDWIVYWQLDLLFTPISFYCWIIWIKGTFTFKHLAFYSLLYISLVGFTLLWVLSFEILLANDIYKMNSNKFIEYMLLSLFPFVISAWNYLLALIENLKLSINKIFILFFSSLSIPISVTVLYKILLIIGKSISPYMDSNLFLEIKNGHLFASIIFTFLIYEGLYFLWLNEKYCVSNTKSVSQLTPQPIRVKNKNGEPKFTKIP